MKISQIDTSQNKKIYGKITFGNKGIFTQWQSNKNFQHQVYPQHSQELVTPHRKSNRKPFVFIGVAFAALASTGIIIHMIKSRKITKPVQTQMELVQNVVLNSKPIEKVKDLLFKNKIVEALRAEGIECDVKSLKSVVGPDEFRDLIKKFKPEHFRAGLQTSQELPLEIFYKNSVDGNFRVSLHTHSNFSDGKATPEEFLECALKYAKKVKSLNKKDGLPPFTIALTDHDNIDGAKEIIRLIAQNSEKYADLKFVAGCEHSVKSFMGNHDVTALAINPFDESLNKMIKELKEKRLQTVLEFLNKEPMYNGKRVTIDDLRLYEEKINKKSGKTSKQTIANSAGVVFVRHAIKYYYKHTGKPVNHGVMNYLGTKDVLPIEYVIENIKKADGAASLTHPLKSFWRYIGDENLLKLKKLGIDGIEANHQYTPGKIVEICEKANMSETADNVHKMLTEKYTNFAIRNDMFISGGTDCHEKQIFSRMPKITSHFLEEHILK